MNRWKSFSIIAISMIFVVEARSEDPPEPDIACEFEVDTGNLTGEQRGLLESAILAVPGTLFVEFKEEKRLEVYCLTGCDTQALSAVMEQSPYHGRLLTISGMKRLGMPPVVKRNIIIGAAVFLMICVGAWFGIRRRVASSSQES